MSFAFEGVDEVTLTPTELNVFRWERQEPAYDFRLTRVAPAGVKRTTAGILSNCVSISSTVCEGCVESVEINRTFNDT